MVPSWLAALAGALAAIVAGSAVLAHGGRFSGLLDLITHFAPLLLILGVTIGVVELAAWRRRWSLMASAVAVIASGALIAPELAWRAPNGPLAPGPGLKLIQFNAWRDNGRCGPIAEWLALERPDVVLLEEATPRLRDCIVGRTGWNVVGRLTTVMIFSPHPLTGIGVRPDVPPEPVPTWVNARLYGPWGKVPVLAAHYTWPTQDLGGRQGVLMERVAAAVGRERLLFGGDFNSTPWSFTRRREDRRLGLTRVTRAVFSWPASTPFGVLPIDHVYVGEGWRVLSVRKGPRLGSDHFPVVVELAPASSRSGGKTQK
jgi:endonuclease/exonuclease/phosphatase (EEP) superfamily protein YafD